MTHDWVQNMTCIICWHGCSRCRRCRCQVRNLRLNECASSESRSGDKSDLGGGE